MKTFRSLQFLTSSPSFAALQGDGGAEVAFAGRSNVGKSSVLNVLANRRDLAKTSSVPGKTRFINLFGLDGESNRRLADLPGYGYAKVSIKEQGRWGRELSRYIIERQSLKGVIVVMDMRHPLTELDRQMLILCRRAGKPVHILLNKSDKLKNYEAASTRKNVEKDLAHLAPSASFGTFSASKKIGVTELRQLIAGWLTPLR